MTRRRAREYVLQMLFQYEFTHHAVKELIDEFWKREKVDKSVMDFANELFKGTIKNIEKIDGIIKNAAEHWILERMASVDRNILRFSCYEILYREDIPPLVSINEALEIAKKYSASESASFINGILDKIAKKHHKVHN